MGRSNGNHETELTHRQLEVVKHLCNGLTMQEVADEMHYSTSSLQGVLKTARKSFHAKTTIHLVSIVIAKGLIGYTPDEPEQQFGESAQPTEAPATHSA